ncbi:hypothetical protein P43SY_007581 [Pythium insidiosum]|uniref:6-phosphofructo-2-kinase domain-containing protein n=1 Tax=Pythium insidiosum TaxID=114742 RepID=A0AAD5QA00_PYTIN|nr:hypothetical protein P43SY_007581 [Pythium insidiosum]
MATAEGRAKAGGLGDAGREVFNDEKIVLVMVGLPARGKSFISHKITNFLSWLGVKAQIFNVGSLRRKLTAGKQSFDFFDASNAAAKQQREDLAFASLQTALQWLGHKRIEKYESVYETLEDDNLSYIKLINMQSKVVCNRIYGNMAHLLVPFLMSIHIVDRPIYICRPAHFIKDPQSLSFRELSGIAEGKEATMLSEAGGRFALRLKELLQREMDSKDGTPLKQLRVYSSPAPRALQTIAPLGLDYRPMSALNLVDSGFLAKMPLSEIKTLMATEWADFCRDPMNYRVHGGESIGDLVRRLSSFVVELERQRKPVLVVSHLLNLQLLYGYVFGHLVTDGLDTNIPMYTVIKLTPTQYGFIEERFDLSDDVV